MSKLVIATRNRGKLREIRTALADLPIEVDSLLDYPQCPVSDEPHSTYLENAREKAAMTAEYCNAWALADDSGLEVATLGGLPGVQSARYAGKRPSFEDNIHKVLKEMEEVPPDKRHAVFRCCMVLRHPDGTERVTWGELPGVIRETPVGSHGFGYDPIFEIPSENMTLAQMSLEKKNKISHRTQALEKMIMYIQRKL